MITVDASALEPRAFTFLDVRERTPTLTGEQRKAVFDALPPILQRECWEDLAEWADDRSAADFELWCGDDA